MQVAVTQICIWIDWEFIKYFFHNIFFLQEALNILIHLDFSISIFFQRSSNISFFIFMPFLIEHESRLEGSKESICIHLRQK